MIITDTEICNPSVPNLPTKAKVEQLCRQKGPHYNRLVYIANGSKFFIKYNNARIAEAHAQLFFYLQIKQTLNSSFYVPEIYHAWLTDRGATYIVMEYIDVDHFASDEQRARAITELISVPPPQGVFGSFWQRGKIRHPFFKDREAYKKHLTVGELQDSVNNVRASSIQLNLM